MERSDVFRQKPTYRFLRWFLFTLLLVCTVGFIISMATALWNKQYISLDLVSFFYLMDGFFWVTWISYSYRQTTFIQLFNNSFVVKKVGCKPVDYPYSAILSHNERLKVDKHSTHNEFTVYLADNWFAIQSNEFEDYGFLTETLGRYGQPVPYRDVITPTERIRIRWFISGLALLIGVTIAFGFAMHNTADPNPAHLITITGIADHIRENKHKGRLIGITISLRAYPSFDFYVSRRNYDVPLDSLASAITSNLPVSLLIRQSDYRKKLAGTEPLTFGDKYDGYKQIMVFGVTQGNSVRLITSQTIYEPTHTTPWLRTFLLSILLLLCWAGWVYVDRLPLLQRA